MYEFRVENNSLMKWIPYEEDYATFLEVAPWIVSVWCSKRRFCYCTFVESHKFFSENLPLNWEFV